MPPDVDFSCTFFEFLTLCWQQGLVPLLGVDMWEHAYYLQYNNVKADYLKEIWKIVNWKDVASRYSKAQ